VKHWKDVSMSKADKEPAEREELLKENERLRACLEKSEQTLQAMRLRAAASPVRLVKHPAEKPELDDSDGTAANPSQPYELLEAVIGGTDVVMATVDRELNYTYFNKPYQEKIETLTGKKLRLGLKVTKVFTKGPEHLELAQEEWKQALQGQQSTRIVHYGVKGQERYYNVVHIPLKDPEGNLTGAGEIGHDITSQILAEQGLMEKEERSKKHAAELDAIITSLPDAITIYDKSGRVLRTNKLTEDYLENAGIKRIKGQYTDLDILDEQGKRLPAQEIPIQKALRGEIVRGEVICVKHGADEPLWISSNAAPIYKEGVMNGAVTVATDITHFKQIEEELRESEKKYRELVKYAPAGIYGVDFKTRKFTSVNDTMCELTGYSREELLKMDPFKILSPESQAQFRNRIQRWRSDEKPEENVEYVVKTKDGRDIYARLNVTVTRDENGNPFGATVVGYDITERRRLEKNVQDIADKYSLLFNTTSEGVWIQNLQGEILEVNQAYCRMSGYTEEELTGMSISKLEAAERPIETAERMGSLMAAGGHERIQTQHRRKDGSIFDVDITAVYLEFEGGRIGIFTRDITSQRKSEEALQVSEEKFSMAFSNNPAAVALTRLEDGIFLDVNDTWETLNGYRREEVLGVSARSLLIWPDREASTRFATELKEKGRLHWDEQKFLKRTGEFFTADLSAQILKMHGEKVILSTFVDITERKEFEKTLQTTLKRFYTMLSSMYSSILVINEENRVEFANQAFCDLFGLTGWPEELVNMTAGGIIERIKGSYLNPEREENRIREILAQDIPVKGEEISLTGGRVCLRDFVPIEVGGKQYGRFWHHLDITSRIQMEEDLKRARLEAEQRADELEAIMESVPVGLMLSRDPQGMHITGNKAAHELLHVLYDESNISKSTPDPMRARTYKPMRNGVEVPPEELPIQKAARGEEVREWDCDLVFDNGEIGHILINATPLYDEKGEPRGAVAGFLDISERKRAEEALRASEQKFTLIYNKASYAISLSDASNGALVDVNAAFEKTFGFTKDEVIGKTSRALGINRDIPERDIMLAGVQEKGGLVGNEIILFTKAGEAKNFRITVDTVELDGGKFLLNTAEDITERKKAEEDLRLSEERFRLALRNAPISVATQDRDLNFQWAFNQRTIPPEQVLGKKDHDLFPPEDAERLVSLKRSVLETGKEIREKLWIHSGGKLVYLDLLLEPLRDATGEIYGIGVVTIDLTPIKKAEEELKKSEERFRSLVELSPDAIFVNRAGRVAMVNPAAVQLFGASKAEELLGKDILELFHPDSRELVRERVEKVLSGGTAPLMEEQILRMDGEIRDTESAGALIMDQQGPEIQMILRDITERKMIENDLWRLNRTLKALSDINQAMVRSTNETDYMNDVCRIVVEDCGHLMVWIGFAEDDEEKSVRPVASAGFEASYLENLKISWADTERGQGPTGTAIRTGQVSLCRNMLTDPKFAPWKEMAVERGYAASIVLPLISAKKVFGAINIYSHKPDPFSQNEIDLLTELASDLAYGISMLRTRIAHTQAEAGLRQSEARFRQLADASFEGLVIHDNGLLLDVNERITKILGYEQDELIGKPFWEFIDKKYHQVVNDNVKNNMTDIYEVELIHKDGRRVPVEVVGAPMVWKEKHVRVSALRDIRERKQAVAEIRKLLNAVQEEKDRLSALVNNIQEEVWFADLNQKFTLVNPAALKEFGLDPNSVLDVQEFAASLEVFRPDGSPRPQDETPPLRALKGETVRNLEEIIRIPSSGEERIREVNASPVRDSQGRIIGSVSVVRDISERKKAEEVLKAANDELRRFNRVMTGRELRMIGLKKEVNELCEKTGEPPRYPLGFDKENP
jgi:PAS domain S-box-containing protein